MKYQRIEDRGAYDIITTVDENGTYEQYIEWHNNSCTDNHYRANIFEWGWTSLNEFLKERRLFKPI